MIKKKAKIITPALIAIIMTLGLSSCNNDEKDTIIEKADHEIEKFSERLQDISQNDPDFNMKVSNAIDDFEESIQNVWDDFEDKGIETEYDIKRTIDDILGKNQNIKRSFNEMKDMTSEDLEDLGKEVEEEFNELKELVKKYQNDK